MSISKEELRKQNAEMKAKLAVFEANPDVFLQNKAENLKILAKNSVQRPVFEPKNSKIPSIREQIAEAIANITGIMTLKLLQSPLDHNQLETLKAISGGQQKDSFAEFSKFLDLQKKMTSLVAPGAPVLEEDIEDEEDDADQQLLNIFTQAIANNQQQQDPPPQELPELNRGIPSHAIPMPQGLQPTNDEELFREQINAEVQDDKHTEDDTGIEVTASSDSEESKDAVDNDSGKQEDNVSTSGDTKK